MIEPRHIHGVGWVGEDPKQTDWPFYAMQQQSYPRGDKEKRMQQSTSREYFVGNASKYLFDIFWPIQHLLIILTVYYFYIVPK